MIDANFCIWAVITLNVLSIVCALGVWGLL
jgi:hypothetical protein